MAYIKWVKGCPYVYKGNDEYLGSYFKYRFSAGRKGLKYTDDIIVTKEDKRRIFGKWTPKMISKLVEIDKLARAAEKKVGDIRRRKSKKK